MPRDITPGTTLENLKREAKRWLRALRANVEAAQVRFQRALDKAPTPPTLRHVQHALAREFGVSGWNALRERLDRETPMRRYARVAEALVEAYRTGEPTSMHIVWDYFGHMRAWTGMRRYVRLDLGKTEAPRAGEVDDITLDEARFLVARAQDFESWDALTRFAASISSANTGIAAKAVRAYTVNAAGAPQEAARSRDWEEIIGLMRERQLQGMHAGGQMTDALLERFSQLEHLTALDLEGSKGLTDDGLRHLGRLPRLRHVNLMGCSITDRGLEVLRSLPDLESIVLTWTPITDAGAAHLAACEKIERVDLMGTPAGDGAIRALAGKAKLRDFRSGNRVTDAGLASLHELPTFKSWHGGEPRMELLGYEAGPTFLILRGRFTNKGLASLVGLDGLFALNVDSDQIPITGAGLAPLVHLPHLAWLAFDANDESMPFIAALPHLRFLMCQDTDASDDGWVALGASRTLEYIWGRRCYNLRRRGFLALAEMPSLAYLSVSCKNVDDTGLSALPRFPALKELMPMDVPDDGYRYIGACQGLESLVLMYCRDTGDTATEHIAGLPRLKKYFASYNRITDRTPEILSGISSLERVTFDSCSGLTNKGVATLATLPRLAELRLSGMPGVTGEVVGSFSERVRVHYGM